MIQTLFPPLDRYGLREGTDPGDTESVSYKYVVLLNADRLEAVFTFKIEYSFGKLNFGGMI